MTLGVMTRACLGHTGRALAADAGTTAIFVLVTLAALARVAAALLSGSTPLLALSAVLWFAAFTLFTAIYGTYLVRPRKAGALAIAPRAP